MIARPHSHPTRSQHLIDRTERPDLPLVSREEFEAVHEEVARLPERYRVPVVLCELEGLTYEEAARQLRCPVATVGARLRRARERLRDALTRRGLAPTASLLCAYSTPILIRRTHRRS